MTVQEQHIVIEQELQRIGYNVTGDFFAKEIDIALNAEMWKYIDDQYDPKSNPHGRGLGDDLKKILNLQRLRKEKKIPLYLDPVRSDRVRAWLPGDFWLIEKAIPHTFDNCKSEAAENESANIGVWVFDLADNDADKFDDLVLEQDGNTLFDASEYPQINSAIEVNQELYVLIDLLIRKVQDTEGYELYWERFDGKYYIGKFILVRYNIAGVGSTTLDVTLNAVTTNVAMTANYSLTSHNRSKTYNLYPGRFPESEDVEETLRNSFGKTTFDSPVVDMMGDYVQVYFDSTFISTYVNIKYIRKPASINLYLGQDCELHPEIHPALNRLTVEHLKAVLENKGGFELAVADRKTDH